VAQFTAVQYQLSLSSDPLLGPYTTSISTVVGLSVTIRLSQVTAGPAANMSVLFGDGSPAQQFYLASSLVNITYNYTTLGTFIVSANVTLVGLSIPCIVNNMTVVVAPPPTYSSN
jgi:hypothetical protein